MNFICSGIPGFLVGWGKEEGETRLLKCLLLAMVLLSPTRILLPDSLIQASEKEETAIPTLNSRD